MHKELYQDAEMEVIIYDGTDIITNSLDEDEGPITP